MLKSTITLKNGVVVNVETESPEQFIGILNGFGPHVANTSVYASTHSERITEGKQPVDAEASEAYGNGKFVWKDNEILEIAALVAQQPKATNEQIANRVSPEMLATHGLQSVMGLVARIHRYMRKGTTTGGITKRTLKVLKKSGYAYKRNSTTSAGRKLVKWSDRDITNIGKIIRNNIDTKDSMAAFVRKYIVNDSDYRDRTDATIYTMSGDIRRYLTTGDQKFIGKKFLSVLKNAGVHPVTTREDSKNPTGGQPTTNFLGDVRRIAVEEA